jgi:hypothetical protein
MWHFTLSINKQIFSKEYNQISNLRISSDVGIDCVEAQFPIGDVAHLLNFQVDYSESEHLHKEGDDRIEERPGVSQWGYSDA